MQIFLIPGWASSSIIFGNLANILSEYGNVTNFSWQDAIGVNSVLEEKIIACTEKILLVGWSLGSVASLKMASKYNDKIAGAILFSATPFLPADDTNNYPGANPNACRAMKMMLKKNPELLLGDFAKNSCFPNNNERQERAFIVNAMLQDQAILPLGLEFLNKTDVRNEVTNIVCPVLDIHGDQDKIVPLEVAHWLKEKIANFQYQAIKNGGHLILATHQQEIIAICQKWISENLSEEA